MVVSGHPGQRGALAEAVGLITDEDFFDPEKNLNAGCKYLKIQRRSVIKTSM